MNVLDGFPQYGTVSADEVEEVILVLREEAADLEEIVDSPEFEVDDEEDEE
jgi:hypothetical protein